MQRWDTIPVKNNSSKMTGAFDKVGQLAKLSAKVVLRNILKLFGSQATVNLDIVLLVLTRFA